MTELNRDEKAQVVATVADRLERTETVLAADFRGLTVAELAELRQRLREAEAEIALLRDLPATLIFYESPKRVGEMLASLRDILGESREAVVCRELTKRFEEVRRGTLGDLAGEFADRAVKGEIVVLVGRAGSETVAEADVEGALREAMKTMRIKDAATAVAGALGLPRRQVYQVALGLEKE